MNAVLKQKERKKPYLTASDISRRLWTGAIAYFESFVRNPPVLRSKSQIELVSQTWQLFSRLFVQNMNCYVKFDWSCLGDYQHEDFECTSSPGDVSCEARRLPLYIVTRRCLVQSTKTSNVHPRQAMSRAKWEILSSSQRQGHSESCLEPSFYGSVSSEVLDG